MKETTSGGLYIYPEILIEGGEETDINTAAKIRAINQEAPKYPETPVIIGVHTIEAGNGLVRNSQSNRYIIQDHSNNKTLLEVMHDFVDDNGVNSPSIMLGNEGMVHEFSRADGNEFFNHIAHTVQENLENGTTNIQELVKYQQRDREMRKKGLGGSQTIASIPDIRDYEDEYVFHELIVDELKKVGKETGQGGGKYRFKEIVPNAMDTFYEKYDKNKEKNVVHDVAADLTRTLASVIVHGVGASNFLDTYLNSLDKSLDNKQKANNVIDMFLGEGGLPNGILGQRLRALPVTSKYHAQLTKNLYKENC